MMNKIATTIANLRKDKGWSQTDLADKSTLKRIQEIQNMSPDAKGHLFSVIDSVIRDYKTRQAYAG